MLGMMQEYKQTIYTVNLYKHTDKDSRHNK